MLMSKNNVIIDLGIDSQWRYVLMNTLFGNVNLLDEPYYEYINRLQSNIAGNDEPEKASRLNQRGYLFQDEDEEQKRASEVINYLEQSILNFNRNYYKIKIQNSCSQNCSYCQYEEHLDNSIISETDLDIIMNFISHQEEETSPKKKPVLSISGGEGLPDNQSGAERFKTILSEYHDLFQQIAIHTFGFNLKRYKDIISSVDPKFLSFLFYLQENEDNSSGSEIFSNNQEEIIDWLRLQGIRIGIIIKVTEDNVARIPIYTNYFIEKGLVFSSNCTIQFKPSFKQECSLFLPCSINYGLYEKFFRLWGEYPQMESAHFHGNGILPILQQLIKTRGRFVPNTHFCKANSNLLIFDNKGNIYTCNHAILYPQLAVGSFHHPGENYIDPVKMAEWRKRDTLQIEKCSQCPGKYLCAGGCSFNALIKNGSSLHPDCQPYKDLIKWAFEGLYEDFLDSARYNHIHQKYVEVE